MPHLFCIFAYQKRPNKPLCKTDYSQINITDMKILRLELSQVASDLEGYLVDRIIESGNEYKIECGSFVVYVTNIKSGITKELRELGFYDM